MDEGPIWARCVYARERREAIDEGPISAVFVGFWREDTNEGPISAVCVYGHT